MKMQTVMTAGMVGDVIQRAMSRQQNGEPGALLIRIDGDGVSISADNVKDETDAPAFDGHGDLKGVDVIAVKGAFSTMNSASYSGTAKSLRPWAFEMHSEVVLETSRAALEDEKRFEREEAARKRARAGAGRTEPSTVIGQTLATLEARTIGVPIERGIVVGRLEYDSGSRQYLVRYKSGAGSQVEAWWDEDALFQDDGDEQVADEEEQR